ncbi:hypothetical protein CYPRO_1334 [Cyclonatronum proteinivorum]|uniref:J domain-containing protein n=1 Tax=Cyclonatronum proteinivorum TaxID=1457365 RepID=A0A345UJD9_9BACT|nr:J domain-containing protein [Cyclonatronum proteinivorum]AXJ00591.1 hypothetical protein CYPRO_1334 [Cyclonatronum proteinivorum]
MKRYSHGELFESFRILELEPFAPIGQVEDARRELSLVWQSDRFQDNESPKVKAEKKRKEIDTAYEIILSCYNHNTERYLKEQIKAESRKRTAQYKSVYGAGADKKPDAALHYFSFKNIVIALFLAFGMAFLVIPSDEDPELSISDDIAEVEIPIDEADPEVIQLSEFIEAFMLEPNGLRSWIMGAGEDTPQIKWTSYGVVSRPDCGSKESCRRGTVRVALGDTELQNLRNRLEPVEWSIFMSSANLSKFGPEIVSIRPHCDTVSCEFEFAGLMRRNGFTLNQLCRYNAYYGSRTGYRVTKSGKKVYVLYEEHLGSGGRSNNLELHHTPPANNNGLCAY